MRERKEAAHVPMKSVTPAKRSMTQLLADEQELKLSAERIAADELYSPKTKQKIHTAIQTSRKALSIIKYRSKLKGQNESRQKNNNMAANTHQEHIQSGYGFC
jgi:hypothetical protein